MKLEQLPHRTIIGWRQKTLDNKENAHRIQFELAKRTSGASALGKQARSKNASTKPKAGKQNEQRQTVPAQRRNDKKGKRRSAAK